MSEELGHLSQDTFENVIKLLASAPEFRDAFEADPIKAFNARDIALSPGQEATLRRIIPLLKIPDQETFDERLVLCSSSGY